MPQPGLVERRQTERLFLLVAVFFHLEGLVDVAFLDVGKLCQSNAALVALGHFLGVVLEALQRCDLVLRDDDAVTDDTHLAVAGDLAAGDTAACNGADVGDLVDLTDLQRPEAPRGTWEPAYPS